MCIYLQIILILNFKMEQMFVIRKQVYMDIPTVYVDIHVCIYIFCGISLFTYTYVYI